MSHDWSQVWKSKPGGQIRLVKANQNYDVGTIQYGKCFSCELRYVTKSASTLSRHPGISNLCMKHRFPSSLAHLFEDEQRSMWSDSVILNHGSDCGDLICTCLISQTPRRGGGGWGWGGANAKRKVAWKSDLLACKAKRGWCCSENLYDHCRSHLKTQLTCLWFVTHKLIWIHRKIIEYWWKFILIK